MKSHSSPVASPSSPVTRHSGSSPELPDDVVLSVSNISKKFCRNLKRSMVYGMHDLASNLVGRRRDTSTLRKDEFWALSDVSFDLKKGETVGIIGLNGAGKSTLLRILNGILPPDKGEVAMRGRIGGLIALGAGMHAHLSGRENIYLNGAILGMTSAEIDAARDAIEEFSELGEFLQAPLATYSSGMRVKLGFAVAIHCAPDILLIDEVLAVGDITFVNKALRKLAEYREQTKAIIYVSHNLEQIRILCQRVILLDEGRILMDGPADETMRVYHNKAIEVRLDRQKNESTAIVRPGAVQVGDAVMALDYGIQDQNGEKVDHIKMSDPLSVYCDFEVKYKPHSLYVIMTIIDEKRNQIIGMGTNAFQRGNLHRIEPGRYRICARVKEHHIQPGVYTPNVAIRNEDTMETYSRFTQGGEFAILADPGRLPGGVIQVREEWELVRQN